MRQAVGPRQSRPAVGAAHELVTEPQPQLGTLGAGQIGNLLELELGRQLVAQAERVSVVESQRPAHCEPFFGQRREHVVFGANPLALQQFRTQRPRVFRIDVDVALEQALIDELRSTERRAVFRFSARVPGQVRQNLTQDDVFDRRLRADTNHGPVLSPTEFRDCQPSDDSQSASRDAAAPRSAPCWLLAPGHWPLALHETPPFAATAGSRWALMNRSTNSSAGERIKSSSVPSCTMRPPPSRITRSPKKPASPISCVTIATVLPSD